MSDVKVAVIGAGSFVFGPSVLKQTFYDRRLNGIDLALMDPNVGMVELMAGVGRRMAAEQGLKANINTHEQWSTALDGADFVLCSAAQQLVKRFLVDCRIIDRLMPDHRACEFGGVAGISYSLRQIALITELTDAMRQRCPKAWLFNAANPLPRVCQAAHENGVRTVGFCSAALGIYGRLWKLFEGEALTYPWQKAREAYALTLGGLNHFSWVLALRDERTGEDLMPALRDKLRAGATIGNPVNERLARETNFLLAPGDSHTRDFLPPMTPVPQRHIPHHGTEEERLARERLLKDVAEGRQAPERLFDHLSWERPVDLVAAMAFGEAAEFDALNLPNTGQITNLPHGVFVETPASATAQSTVPQRITLPSSILPFCRHTALVTDTIVRAARTHSLRLLQHAVELDPTITDKAAGRRAVRECIEAHSDVVPDFH